jgi:hypothetical protein
MGTLLIIVGAAAIAYGLYHRIRGASRGGPGPDAKTNPHATRRLFDVLAILVGAVIVTLGLLVVQYQPAPGEDDPALSPPPATSGG